MTIKNLGIHEHSIKAFNEEAQNLKNMEQAVVLWYKRFKQGTDRQIMRSFKFVDPNQVRPVITKLKKKESIIECGAVKCEETGKTVRVTCLKPTKPVQVLMTF